jgi:outer membrane protein assembly factor BamB
MTYPRKTPPLCLGLCVAVSSLTGVAKADEFGRNWITNRSPEARATSASSESMRSPVQWSASENIRWRTPLNGRGASTPIVVDGQIFVTDGTDSENRLRCIAEDGSISWSVDFGTPIRGKHKNGTAANPSPVSDGQHVVAYFKSGDIACCDLDGTVQWKLNLQEKFGEDTLWWDLGTSPVIADGKVIVAVMQSGPSYIVALDLPTGKVVWKADRSMNVNDESNQSYTTPVVVDDAGTPTLLTLGADHLTAHRVSDGKFLWKLGGFNRENMKYDRSISSPLVVDDLILCPYERGETMTAVRWAASVAESDRIAWQRDDLGADVPTPTGSSERVYINDDKGLITCIDPKSGQTIWQESLPKNRNKYYSSPTILGDQVYFTREDGVTFVIQDSGKFQLLATNAIDASTVSTPVAFGDALLIRSFEELICIEN